MKALVGAFNQEKALVGAFSVIVKTGCGTDGSIYGTNYQLAVLFNWQFTEQRKVLPESREEMIEFPGPRVCMPAQGGQLDL